MTIRIEDRIKVIRWKLGLPGSGENPAELQRIWEELQRNAAEFKLVTDQISLKIGQLLTDAIRAKLTGVQNSNTDWAIELADQFAEWAKKKESTVLPKLAGVLRMAFDEKTLAQAPKSTPLRAAPPVVAPPPAMKQHPGLHPNAGVNYPPVPLASPLGQPPMQRPDPSVVTKVKAPVPPPLPQQPPPLPGQKQRQHQTRPSSKEDCDNDMVLPLDPFSEPNVSDPQQSGSSAPNSMWQYKPLPNDPDPHAEFDARPMPEPPPGFKVFGARVRGKKHKHDGTNCDDWFEFAQAGAWTVIAVSDGAGSYKFSRIGAKVSCDAAVKALSSDLNHHHMEPRETLGEWASAQAREADLKFAAVDLETVQRALHRAVRKAHEAVVAAFQERIGSAVHEAVLPANRRPLDVKEFSSTLLLAVHRTIEVQGKELSFVMACQVGDGMTGAIHRNGSAYPLGAADSGGYSGETEFLTSTGKCEPQFLSTKTVSFVNPLQALLVMTDGVADDYFPGDVQLGRLWADLVVNGIAEHDKFNERDMANAVSNSGLPTLADVRAAEIGTSAEVIDGPEPRTAVWLKSAEMYAEKLGITVDELLKQPAALAAGTLAKGSIPGSTPEERLRLWLDAYHVRGSFDDRTLVVMHREALP